MVLAIALVVTACDSGTRSGGDVGPTISEPSAVNQTTAPGAEPVGIVTLDGSKFSTEITADRIEPGVVLFDVVNATEKRAMFDSWRLLDGYTVRAFAATIERDRRRAEPWIFPDQETGVSDLGSGVIPANSSGSVVTTMSPGRHAIVCMQLYEGEVIDFRPFGVVGPIVVQ